MKPVLTHEQVWKAIDGLGARYGLTPSALARKAGLDPTTRMHDLRHTACSIWIASGPAAHSKLVSEMAGHSSHNVTMDLYSHLFPAAYEQVAAQVEEMRQANRRHLRAV